MQDKRGLIQDAMYRAKPGESSSFIDWMRQNQGGAGWSGGRFGNALSQGAAPQVGDQLGGAAASQPPAAPSRAASPGGFQRVSPGMYQGPDGKIVRSAQNPGRRQNAGASSAPSPMTRQPAAMPPSGAPGFSGMAQGAGAGMQAPKMMPGLGNRPQRPGGPGPQTGGPLVSALGGMDPQQQPGSRQIDWDAAIQQRQQQAQQSGAPMSNPYAQGAAPGFAGGFPSGMKRMF